MHGIILLFFFFRFVGVTHQDFYTDLLNKPGLLEGKDTANLWKGRLCYVALKTGLFSDETDGLTINEFFALCAK